MLVSPKTEVQLSKIAEGELDAGFLLFRPLNDPLFAGIPVFKEKMLLAYPTEWKWPDNKEPRYLRELQNLDFIWLPRTAAPAWHDRLLFERKRSIGTNGMRICFRLTMRKETSMQKFSLLKRRPVRHRAEYDRLYLTRDQQLSCFDPIANREHQRASTTREYRRNWRTSSVRLK
ncbi:LysR substrate-binding domain-containing protein [Klebsiella pneumoniae]|uniref:LysR substrate-binding domain-containing protein n=1 Tax=Klebsiella pneumoniae TaxID=573 RepID=UPI002E78C554|nr:LysR substrate-binding domain-containing protein [Klebsiella pneumoniae]